MKVSIVGAGMMGRGIGTRFVSGGHDVELIDNDREHAEELADELSARGPGRATLATAPGRLTGEVVVLAVPYGAVADVVATFADQLVDKVVVDITNPVDFATFEGVVTPAGSSAAEEIAKLVPAGASVVKAFNTTFGRTLVEGKVAGHQLDVLIAGDDDAAKGKVAALVEAGSLRAIDAGPLRRARQLEQLGFLHMSMQERLDTGFGSAVKFIW